MSNDKKTIRFFTFEKFHNKKNTGSTRIRVANLVKNWPEAELYKYGEKADVMIFQKVYAQPDFDFPITYPAIKILDVCDPDWLEDMPIKRTIDGMDAITVPTEALKEFIEQMTDKPVKVIKDRFDLSKYPTKPKTHYKKAESLVWFGYSHNARNLKGALNSIIELDLKLTVISNKEPGIMGWAEATHLKKDKYEYIVYKEDEVNYELSQHDIAILPYGNEPKDRFKSENKDIIANLCGLPVVKDREQLEKMLEPKARNAEVKEKHAIATSSYNCVESVLEMKALIEELRSDKKD